MLLLSHRRSAHSASIVPHAWRAAALLVLSALPATAQEDRLLRLEQPCRYTFDLTVDSAKAMGLPDAPLRSTALLGIQSKVDQRRICEAIRTKFGHLKTAQSVLGAVGDQELDAASRVLEAGAKPVQLAAFKPRQKGRNDLNALTVWTDLMYRGVPKEEASSGIIKLWQDGADEATFLRLWNDVQSDINQGLNPGGAFRSRILQTPVRAPPKP